jgi:hypothetical protein
VKITCSECSKQSSYIKPYKLANSANSDDLDLPEYFIEMWFQEDKDLIDKILIDNIDADE